MTVVEHMSDCELTIYITYLASTGKSGVSVVAMVILRMTKCFIKHLFRRWHKRWMWKHYTNIHRIKTNCVVFQS